jgi:hypothetical protein
METRPTTHAEAVYLARTLNLKIESVWEAIRHRSFSSFADLELALHSLIAKPREPGMGNTPNDSSV